MAQAQSEKYLAAHKIQELVEGLVNRLAEEKPEDPRAFLAAELGYGLLTPVPPAGPKLFAGPEGSGPCPCGLLGDLHFCEPVTKGPHPPWYSPADGQDKGLRVHNSLTNELEPFKPAFGNRVLWYTCGPTVYDSCHMGHARAYLTFDILRRVIEDYFGYDVLYQTNITDIDDKIILRARQNKLLADFEAALPAGDAGIAAVAEAVDAAIAAKGAKMAEKLADLSAALPDGTDKRVIKEREELKKQQALKQLQFEETSAKVATVHACIKDSAAAVEAALLEEAKEHGGGAADAAALKEALVAKGIAIDDVMEAMRSDGKAEGDAALAVERDTREEVSTLEAKTDAVLAVKGDSATLAMLAMGRSELAEKLDAEKGHEFGGDDHEIFDAHARAFEKEYLDDMKSLGVREPDVMTRVTEYVPQIVDFVNKIVEKGLAYESQGSVYLSINDFKSAGHDYRKLDPDAGNTTQAEMEEGEGALGGDAAAEKRNPNDFALWKASKPGEPAWPSPWGKGRPGWHIECSVVAGDILGSNMDIHAGGQDLKFPHHDNELAQSEAYYGHQQWVNYFFHAGHLSIKGLKMSKSLKNFIKIRQALEEHSPRQLRLMFLLQPWDRGMNYSDQTVGDAKSKEAQLKVFFGTVKAMLRTDWLSTRVGWQNKEDDLALYRKLADAQENVHKALCNNIDTVGTMGALVDLVTYCTAYIEAKDRRPAVYLLQRVATYITQILTMFGVVEGSDEIGFPMAGGGGSAGEVEATLNAMAAFRDAVRGAARSKQDHSALLAACDAVPAVATSTAVRLEDQVAQVLTSFQATIRKGAEEGKPHSFFLDACDDVRDNDLVDVGVRLEDKADGSIWKLDDAETLRKEVADKRAKEKAALVKKNANKVAKLKKEVTKFASAATLPADFFKGDARFSALGDNGLPTKDAKGEELTKSALKKVSKELQKHTKVHDEYTKKGGESMLADLQKQIAALSI